MPNIAFVLKDEISRVSRKEMRRETSSLKKSSTTHRSEIAALKRRVQELERQLRRLGRAGESAGAAAANEDSISPGTRFSARSITAQRKRLGLSAMDCGLLIGASAQSIYNWEEGKARPRAQEPGSTTSERDPGEPQSCLAESWTEVLISVTLARIAPRSSGGFAPPAAHARRRFSTEQKTDVCAPGFAHFKLMAVNVTAGAGARAHDAIPMALR